MMQPEQLKDAVIQDLTRQNGTLNTQLSATRIELQYYRAEYEKLVSAEKDPEGDGAHEDAR